MTSPLLPIFVKLAGRPCLVVGGGTVGAAKIAALLDAGARVTVVAPRAVDEVRGLSSAGKLQWREREFHESDLAGAFLVIAATSDRAVNHKIFLEANNRGILCNAVDDPPNCDFYFSAVVRRGNLQVAISTSGESPGVAQRLRREIDDALDPSLGDWLRRVGELRREIIASHSPSEERQTLLQSLANSEVREDQPCGSRTPGPESAKPLLHAREGGA